MRPRDSRGRYTKISSQNFPIFGDKTPSSSRNPGDSYTCNQREESNTHEIVGKQLEESTKSNFVGEKTESPQKYLLEAFEAYESTKFSPIREDPILENIMDLDKINALFGNISEPVFYQIDSTLISPKPSKGNIFFQPRTRVEWWDLTSSSREGI